MYRSLLTTATLLIGLSVTPALAEQDLSAPGHRGAGGVFSERAMVDATYLGVTASRLSPAMNSQLKLPEGLGLLVTHIAPESPAAEAGIREHDVLHKLDDQLLVNFEQLAVLIRTYEPGDTVTLSLIRAGQPEVIEATLGQHQVNEASQHLEYPIIHHMGGAGRATILAPSGRRSGAGSYGGYGGDLFVRNRGYGEDTFQSPAASSLSASRIRINDGEHTIHLHATGDKRMHLKVEDAEGDVLYDGPWNTDQDPAETGLSGEVLEKVKSIQADIHLDEGVVRIHTSDLKVKQAAPVPDTDPMDGD